MNPESRTTLLFSLLGWDGGAIHQACAEVGLDVHDFLYGDADFSDSGPCAEFRKGYRDVDYNALYLHQHKGDLQYWFGAISALNNREVSA